MNLPCLGCARTAPDGRHLCPSCTGQVRAWLTDMPRLAASLDDFLQPSTGPRAGRTGGTGRAHAPAPVDLRVLALLGPGQPVPPPDPHGDADHSPVPIRAWLRGWADFIATEHPACHRDTHGTLHIQPCETAAPAHPLATPAATWSAWLTAYLHHIAASVWAGEFYRQLDDLTTLIRDLTHDIPHHHELAAPCPKCDRFGLVRIDGRWDITCQVCNHRMDPDVYDKHSTEFLATIQETAG